MRRYLLIALLCCIGAGAQNIVQAASGSACSTSTWTGGVVPTSGNTISLLNTGTPTLDIPVGCTFTVGTSPAAGGTAAMVQNITAITVEGSFTLQGPVTGGNAPLTVGAGGVFSWDGSLAASPSTATYEWSNAGFSRGNRKFNCTGTALTTGNLATIKSNPSGGAGYFAGAAGSSDTVFWNCNNALIQNIGDTTNYGITFNSASDTTGQSFTNVNFDHTGGVSYGSARPVPGSHNTFQNVTYTNTNAKNNSSTTQPSGLVLLAPTSSAFTGTGFGLVDHNVFDTPPLIVGSGWKYTNNVILDGFGLRQDFTGSASNWAQFDSNIVYYRAAAGGNLVFAGDITNNWLAIERSQVSPLYSGTATSAANPTPSGAQTTYGTLTVSGTPWTANAYQSQQSGGFNNFSVAILSGTGAGQIKAIVANTTNVLTVLYAWTTIPDATSTFSIFQAESNPKIIGAQASTTMLISGNIIENLWTDNNGDCILRAAAGTVITVSGNLFLPSASRDDPCTMATVEAPLSGATYIFTGNTGWGGAQSPALNEGGSLPANSVTSYKSNLFMQDPAMTNIYAVITGSGIPTIPDGLSGWKVTDDSPGGPSTATPDIITAGQADYNGGYGLKTSGSYAGNGYNYNATVTPGTHDVNANPMVTDWTRGYRTWAIQAGAPGDIIAAGDYAKAQFALMNQPGANPNFTFTSMYAWIRAGWQPTNRAFCGTGFGGADIGAIPCLAPPAGANVIISGQMTIRNAKF